MIRKALIAGSFALILFSSRLAFAFDFGTSESSWLYSKAIQDVKQGNLDTAFLELHSLVTDFPRSGYTEKALFAIGEYHFLNRNYANATETFLRILTDYPDSPSTVFALAYLLKTAEVRNERSLIPELEKSIATFYQLSLVFRNSKQYTYQSALLRKHKVVYYIDKVDFFINGELFAQISY